MTLKFDEWPKKNKAPFLYYIKLYVSFQIHRWIQTGVTVRKRSFRVKIGDFLSCVTLKFDGWPWKTIGHLFYNTLSFVQHFKPIGIFKLELQSENAQFGSKLVIFCKFDGWPWKSIRHIFSTTLSLVQHFKGIGIFKLELQSGNTKFGSKLVNFCLPWPWKSTDDLEIGCFKLCASFYSHWWIQTRVTVRKRTIRVKIGDFLSPVTLEIDEWPWKTIAPLYFTTSGCVHHFKSIVEVKLELQSGNAQFGSKSTIFFSHVTLKFDIEKQ